MSDLQGIPLRYLVDTDKYTEYYDPTQQDIPYEILVVSRHWDKRAPRGIPAKLIDLLSTEYGPFIEEGVPDPKGTGFWKNLHFQLEKAQNQGFKLVVLDNMENKNFNQYELKRAIDVVYTYKLNINRPEGIGVILKNVSQITTFEDLNPLISHINVFGLIAEYCGNPVRLDMLRRDAEKPDLPIWFITKSFGKEWAQRIVDESTSFCNIGITYSSDAILYSNSNDLLVPKLRVHV
ncbi:MAG TPA: hypothetical protein VEP90_04120 [Methylomirabilota bacterium]|nr:hypothetical protein [Methylomirabilota bacterium]